MSTEPELRDAMRRMLAPVSPSWVAAQVGVTRQQVDRWKNGHYVTAKRVGAVAAAIARLLPETQKDAPPAEASGAVAPEWALQLTKELRDEIVATRSAVVAPLAREVATRAGEELRELLPQLLAALAQAGEDQ